MARVRRRRRGMRGAGNSGVRDVKPRGGNQVTVKPGSRGTQRRTGNYGSTTSFNATSHGRTKEEVDLWDVIVPDSEESDDGVEPRRRIRGTVKPGSGIRRCTGSDGTTTGFSRIKEDNVLQRDLTSEVNGDGVVAASKLAADVSDLAPEVVARLQELLADTEPVLHEVIVTMWRIQLPLLFKPFT